MTEPIIRLPIREAPVRFSLNMRGLLAVLFIFSITLFVSGVAMMSSGMFCQLRLLWPIEDHLTALLFACLIFAMLFIYALSLPVIFILLTQFFPTKTWITFESGRITVSSLQGGWWSRRRLNSSQITRIILKQVPPARRLHEYGDEKLVDVIAETAKGEDFRIAAYQSSLIAQTIADRVAIEALQAKAQGLNEDPRPHEIEYMLEEESLNKDRFDAIEDCRFSISRNLGQVVVERPAKPFTFKSLWKTPDFRACVLLLISGLATYGFLLFLSRRNGFDISGLYLVFEWYGMAIFLGMIGSVATLRGLKQFVITSETLTENTRGMIIRTTKIWQRESLHGIGIAASSQNSHRYRRVMLFLKDGGQVELFSGGMATMQFVASALRRELGLTETHSSQLTPDDEKWHCVDQHDCADDHELEFEDEATQLCVFKKASGLNLFQRLLVAFLIVTFLAMVVALFTWRSLQDDPHSVTILVLIGGWIVLMIFGIYVGSSTSIELTIRPSQVIRLYRIGQKRFRRTFDVSALRSVEMNACRGILSGQVRLSIVDSRIKNHVLVIGKAETVRFIATRLRAITGLQNKSGKCHR